MRSARSGHGVAAAIGAGYRHTRGICRRHRQGRQVARADAGRTQRGRHSRRCGRGHICHIGAAAAGCNQKQRQAQYSRQNGYERREKTAQAARCRELHNTRRRRTQFVRKAIVVNTIRLRHCVDTPLELRAQNSHWIFPALCSGTAPTGPRTRGFEPSDVLS